MKMCGKCRVPKSESAFQPNRTKKDGLQSICHECMKIVQHAWYLRNKERLIEKSAQTRVEYKEWWDDLRSDLYCEECGENHPSCLDFHHKDPSQKKYNVSQMVNLKIAKWKILLEISKCRVLCSNCHRKLHWKQALIPNDGIGYGLQNRDNIGSIPILGSQ